MDNGYCGLTNQASEHPLPQRCYSRGCKGAALALYTFKESRSFICPACGSVTAQRGLSRLYATEFMMGVEKTQNRGEERSAATVTLHPRARTHARALSFLSPGTPACWVHPTVRAVPGTVPFLPALRSPAEHPRVPPGCRGHQSTGKDPARARPCSAASCTRAGEGVPAANPAPAPAPPAQGRGEGDLQPEGLCCPGGSCKPQPVAINTLAQPARFLTQVVSRTGRKGRIVQCCRVAIRSMLVTSRLRGWL